MVDVVEGLAKGKCLDLSQSLPIENLNIKIEGTTDISAINDSAVSIITAGIARKPGMTRDDLVEKNSIENSKSLITLGLGYEWTFEKDYYEFYKRNY